MNKYDQIAEEVVREYQAAKRGRPNKQESTLRRPTNIDRGLPVSEVRRALEAADAVRKAAEVPDT